jgi:hypothetical protein
MLPHPTLDKLHALKLTGMVQALTEQMTTPDITALSFEERLGLLVDREMTERDNRRLKTRLHQAKLRQSACLEDLDYRPPRGLDKSLLTRLALTRKTTSMAHPSKPLAAIAVAACQPGAPFVPSHREQIRVLQAKNQPPKGDLNAQRRRTTPPTGHRQIPGWRQNRRHLSADDLLKKLALQVEGALPGRRPLLDAGEEQKTQDPCSQNARLHRTGHHRPASYIGPKPWKVWCRGHPAGTPTARDRPGTLAPHDLSDSPASRQGGELNFPLSSSG